MIDIPIFTKSFIKSKKKIKIWNHRYENIKLYDDSLYITIYYGYKKQIVKKLLFIDMGHSKSSFYLLLNIMNYQLNVLKYLISNILIY